MLCSACQAQNAVGANFCQLCGARLQEAGRARAIDGAERRQLTIVFCDMVGSSTLASRLDPEDFRDVIAAYQRTCTRAVERLDGHVAQYLGDGVLLYFGFPVAHEDDAERAALAGLTIVEELPATNAELQARHGVQIAVRVGIHTGPVVVGQIGDESRRETLALGGTTNVAARLQEVAEPNSVVISDATRRLLRGTLETRALGLRELAGIGRVAVHRVTRASGTRGGFESRHPGPTPLVGRTDELVSLRAAFDAAERGEGGSVLLVGEAGVGKSRLTEAFRDALSESTHLWVSCACSPHTSNTPFAPVARLLERMLGVREPALLQGRALERLEAQLARAGLDPAEGVPLIAALMSRPTPSGYSRVELHTEAQRIRMQETLVAWILGAVPAETLVLLVEDVHWADPSLLETLARATTASANARVLIVFTARPTFQPPDAIAQTAKRIALQRLEPEQARQMAVSVARGVTLPEAALDAVIARSDGLPLYLEEIIRDLVDSCVEGEGGRLELQGRVQDLAIPATLQDSLMARLDRLSAAKSVAQIAATIGRQFSYELLVMVADADEALLRHGLARLVEAELLFVDGRLPDAVYTFKHALIQDAAYGSLLHATRRALHRRIAEALEQRAARAEVLAHHFERAGALQQALRYYADAADQAHAVGSSHEAIALLRRGLALIDRLPESTERHDMELGLQLRLGSTLHAAIGISKPETQQAWERARALCDLAGSPAQLATALRGLAAFYDGLAEMDTASALGQQLERLGQRTGDAGQLAAAHAGMGVALFWKGNFASCVEHLDTALELYRPDQHAHLAFSFGIDHGVEAFGFSAWALWTMGMPDRAEQRIQAGVRHAATLEHRYSQAYAGMLAAVAYMHRGQWDACREHAQRCLALCVRHGYPLFRGVVSAVLAVAAACERREDLIERALSGLGEAAAAGQRAGAPGMLWMLARIHAELGRPAESLATLDTALQIAAETRQAHFDSELMRLRAELLIADDESRAEIELTRALEVARAQQARLFELRAAITLGQLWKSRGLRAQARVLVAPALHAIRGGHELPDIARAQALLDSLR